MKRIVLVLSAVLMLTACGGKKAESPSALIEAETVPEVSADVSEEQITGGFVAVVNGEKLMPEDIGYYVYNNAVIQMYRLSPEGGDIDSFDWSQPGENGRPLSENITEDAVEDAINDLVFRQEAEKSGYPVSEARREAEELINGARERKGEDGFLKTAKALGISDPESYVKIYTNISVFDGVANEFCKDPDKYVADPSAVDSFAGDKGATVKQILIMNDTDKGDPAEIAAEILAQIDEGADFGNLMRDYNEDVTGSDSISSDDDGKIYTFPKGEMVEEFENAAFALNVNEVSGIVQSSYGYHIIKRIRGAYELQAYWRSLADVTVAENAAELVDFDSVMSMVKASKSGD